MQRIVVVAEKPKAAEKIAQALGSAKKQKKYGVPYWEITNGARIVVVPAAGHLFGLAPASPSFPVFSYEWRPLYEVDKNAKYTKKFLSLIKSVCRGADLYVNACDYDIEGSVIGYMIIKNFGDLKRSKRMIFHALTPDELKRAWKALKPLDWNMVEAGLARHELDWLWGINVSRALMRAYKIATGKSKSLSAGRVQSPTLKEAVKRELSILTHVPLPYYGVSVKVKGVPLEPALKFERKSDVANWSGKCIGKVTGLERSIEALKPPHPFNLPDLQMEAARLYGFSPARTQSIAEDLYLDALISYPRTNSQKYPKDLDFTSILTSLKKATIYGQLVRALFKETKGVFKPHNGPKDDPAHPAIYPTGKLPRGLDDAHAKIYDLIVRRFLATLATPARFEIVKVYIILNNKRFRALGRTLVWKGWGLYYPFSLPQEKVLPPFEEDEEVEAVCEAKLSYTKAPERYTKAKLVKWMEKVGIGTEATRARIVETLFKRGYLKSVGGKVHATELGMGVALVLEEFFEEITSVELTRKFEEKMNSIMKGEASREEVVSEAKELLKHLLSKYKPHLRFVGKKLAVALGEEAPEKKCALCNREAKDELCFIHEEAYSALTAAYPEWKKRLGVGYGEYLQKLAKLKSTGGAVREVAAWLLKDGRSNL